MKILQQKTRESNELLRLRFSKVYIELKNSLENAKNFESTIAEDIKQLEHSEIVLEEARERFESKLS